MAAQPRELGEGTRSCGACGRDTRGDEEDNGKEKKLLISKKPLNEFFQERSNIGYQLTENDIENIMPLMITGYYKKQE